MCLKNLTQNEMTGFIVDVYWNVGKNRSDLLICEHRIDRKDVCYLSKNNLQHDVGELWMAKS